MNKPNNLIDQFKKLTRNTRWVLKTKIELQFNHYHSQGLVRIGDLFYLSSVEMLEKPIRYDVPQNGYDRTPGRGIGHLFMVDKHGKLLHDTLLGEGDIYHPGGIDFDGAQLWVPVAEYRPHSKSIVYTIDPTTMKATESFRVDDHIGGLVRNRHNGSVVGNSWGSRKLYEWTQEGLELLVTDNPSHFVDYQDGQYVGDGKMLLCGISELTSAAGHKVELGGLALIDMTTMHTIHEIPITEYSVHGHVITRNPLFVESTGEALRLYAVPDDDHGAILIYETMMKEARL